MKSIPLVLLIFLSVSVKSYSQIAWAPPSAKWTYHGPGDFPSYIEIAYEKDSIVLGKLSKILTKKHYIGREQLNDVVVENLGIEITYEEDSVIYLYTANQFDTLFSFKTTIGDTWILHCYPNSGICGVNAIVEVVDTGTILINDSHLRTMVLEYEFEPGDSLNSWKTQDTIIERIGSINSYFLPWDLLNQLIDMTEEGAHLRCYYDDHIGSYSNNYDKPCNYLASINQSQLPEVRLYPNPCEGYLNIEFSDDMGENLKVNDVSGRILLNQSLHGQNCIINLTTAPRGILFLEITTSKSKVYNRLIIN